MKVSTMRNLQFTTFRQYPRRKLIQLVAELKISSVDRAFIGAGTFGDTREKAREVITGETSFRSHRDETEGSGDRVATDPVGIVLRACCGSSTLAQRRETYETPVTALRHHVDG